MNTAGKAVSSSLQSICLNKKRFYFKIILDDFCVHALYLSHIKFFPNLNKIDKTIKCKLYTHWHTSCYIKIKLAAY